MAKKCSECRFAKRANMPRFGNSGSWRSGRFQQLAHICQHPGCGNMLSVIYYGATAPRDCPMQKPSAASNTLQGEYKFSPWRILDAAAFCSQNEAFVSYCKQAFSHGTFSTYADGEPVFLTGDMESIMKKWKDGKDRYGLLFDKSEVGVLHYHPLFGFYFTAYLNSGTQDIDLRSNSVAETK